MSNNATQLWYDKPADAWTQALPLGNGRLGAMLFGGIRTERVALNHDELWTGRPKDTTRPGSAEAFLRARSLALEDKFPEAQMVVEKEFASVWSQAYMPLGELEIQFSGIRSGGDFRRSLDLDTALHSVQYLGKSGVCYTREAFASHPDNAIVMKLRAENGKMDFCLRLHTEHRASCHVQDNLLLLDGECPSENNKGNRSGKHIYYKEPERRGICFRAALRVESDGCITAGDDTIRVSQAAEAVLYFSAFSSFNGWNRSPFLEGREYKERCLEHIRSLGAYETLKARHTADYQVLFRRVKLDLGDSGGESLPTDLRLSRFQETREDLSLYTLLFNFGRYLIIASSREGTQPGNLQGIWNDNYRPPWNSNYTVNINTEMNYWPVLPCALPDLHLPLVEMIRELSVSGEATARVHYGAPGFVCHHNTDLWRLATPVSGNAVWLFWPMGSGWLCRHLFEHYEYTADLGFLRDIAYPILKKAAQFYLSLLVEDPDGYLVLAPSTSPENHFKIGKRSCAVALSSTMTISILRDLFGNCLRGAELLQIADDFTAEVSEKLEKLPPFQIGSKRQLLEWEKEYEETDPRHRHVSHLYGLHPARLITPEDTPELAQACRRSLELRGDAGTGWSLGWKINFWARLREGNRALELLERQLRPVKSKKEHYSSGGTYENLFDAHPPFQIDGNFGAVSGIVEMLLQSEPGNIRLLPALPAKWVSGSVKGLAAKGNLRVDIAWENGQLSECKLRGQGVVTVAYGSQKKTVTLNGGETAIYFD